SLKLLSDNSLCIVNNEIYIALEEDKTYKHTLKLFKYNRSSSSWDQVGNDIISNIRSIKKIKDKIYFYGYNISSTPSFYEVYSYDINSLSIQNRGNKFEHRIVDINEDSNNGLYILSDYENGSLYKLNSETNEWEKIKDNFTIETNVKPLNSNLLFVNSVPYVGFITDTKKSALVKLSNNLWEKVGSDYFEDECYYYSDTTLKIYHINNKLYFLNDQRGENNTMYGVTYSYDNQWVKLGGTFGIASNIQSIVFDNTENLIYGLYLDKKTEIFKVIKFDTQKDIDF
ncbi:MAG TPA: hypothetical protein PK771_11765, partial [Spirochaetota bacterium]|nr:hypothetical protein [Spirochaetota bacterium]